MRALSVAREQGMPAAVLTKAEEILGDSWRRQQERESEAEAAIERLREAERELATERERFQAEAEKTSVERDSLARERVRLAREGLERFDKARREMTRRLDEGLAEIRKDSSHHAELSAVRPAGEIAESVERQEGIAHTRHDPSAPPDTPAI